MGRLTKVTKAQRDANFEKIFGAKKPNPDLDDHGRVRYKAHPETGEMIPDFMWDQLGMAPVVHRSHFIQGDYEPFVSPVTGKVVSGRRQRRYDMESTGHRAYEGRRTETIEAQGIRDHRDRRLDEKVEKSMMQTLSDIRHGNNPPPERDKKTGKPKISFTF